MMNTGSTAATLLELLRERASDRAGDPAYVFLQDGEQEAERLTYGELDRQARAIAARLEERGARGERVLLLFTPGLEFVASFFGCLYAGAVAVPSYPPRPGRSQPRLASIAQGARPRFALTNAAIAAKTAILEDDIPALAGVEWIVPGEIPAGFADAWREPSVGPDTLAFLQYTSGSTSDPKGVMVSHGNLLDNQRVIQETCGHNAESTFVSWLPMFHDMGLIGCVLQPLYLGALGVLMAPSAFLQRPVRWLQAISTWRAHTSGAPNFAYDLCVRKIPAEERALLDLSSWHVAFNGAEPVRASTLEDFAAAFEVAGFRRTAFLPCYGLAEATLMVSGASRREPRVEPFQGLDQGLAVPAEGGRPLVSCGPVDPRQKVVIADPVSLAEQPPGSIGEIWVSGPSVAQGYWERPEESVRTFGARLGDRTFLRTGDLGFLDGGELFVTGRVKDLIIVRGRNHYPQDVEVTAERSHAAVRPGGSAAFSVDDGGEERLVVVVERERRSGVPADEVAEAVRRAVEAEHEVEVHEVVLTRADTVPKTSSGKVQRALCRTRYLAGELPVLGKSTARTPLPESAGAPDRQVLLAASPSERRALVEAYLRRQTGLSGADDRPLAGLGMDSLRILELTGRVERDLGVSLPLSDLFEAPGLSALAELILAEWNEDGPRTEAVRITAEGPTEGDHPLSHGQRALWFLDRLAPETSVYNLAVAGLWRNVQPERLIEALRRLVERHPSLRTTFIAVDGEPVQRVHPFLEPEVLVEDASEWDEARMADFAWRPFDLSRGPLLRAAMLVRPEGRLEEETAVVLAAHHIVVDLWSFAVLLRELAALVRQDAVLPPLALRYTDFARWQRRRLEGEEGERLWAYWRERLSGDLPALDLPADRPRPPVQTYNGAAEPAEWDAELALALRGLGHARGATLYMTLLTGFFALLHRLAGQDDLIVGSPAAGRQGDGLAGLVGYFVQPLALRAGLAGDPSFEGLLAQVRRTVVEGFEHQGFPVPLLAERLQPVRDPGRSPLFQVMFALQSTLGDTEGISAFGLGRKGVRLQLGGVEMESLALEERRAPFDLTLTMADLEGRLAALLQWNRDLFDPETARRMLGHLHTLLSAAAADPGRPVSALPLLTGDERQQILHGWNQTATEIPEPALVHELFAAAAARSPEAVAVDVEGVSPQTYRELAERAGQLARHLRGMGVVPDTRVGILLHRSEDMLASLLAVLEAGGAYLPLDPAYPRERLELMLRDSGAPVVMTESRLAGLLPQGVQAFCLDADLVPSREGARTNPSPENLAYVIYTSGSTGRPKGVQLTHRALVNLLLHLRGELEMSPADVVLAVTTLSFDIATMELLLPLISGARVTLARRETAMDGRLLAREIERSGATLLQATPTTWRLLLEAEWQGSPRLKALSGGEALPRELADRLLARTARLWNGYGPTETTIYSSMHRVEAGDGPVSSGGPVANTEIHLLDRHLEPVPPGVTGVLYIGGEGLARGYLDRPELTAAAFMPDPWSPVPGRRLYRTGDLARFRPGRGIEYLGRGDSQVKVRGFRIELGEIEAALARHPAVSQAVVAVREDRLVAYVVAGTGVDAAGLRAHLRASLPEHFVPGSFVLLPELPKTPSGKTDRRALPAPEGEAAQGARKPQGAVEEVLAGLWQEALGRSSVGADESFFDLGGHSLLAARLLARIRAVFLVELPLSALFETPTVAGLASRIEAARGQAPAPALRPVPHGAELPLSPAQLRLWFLAHLAPDSAAYNIPLAVRLEGPLDREALAASCAEVVRRHEALRTTFHRTDEPVQLVSPSVPSSVLDLSVSPSVCKPFDLATGPLIRFELQEHLLVITAHHIICDGASLEVLVREIAALYGGETLPGPRLQLGDFVLWQRQWIEEGGIEPGLAWWRKQLAGMPAVLDLPTDRPRPPAQSFAGSVLPLRPGFALDRTLDRLSQGRGTTRFMALLAGFAALLERTSGQADFAIGSPFVDSRAALSGAVGLFINTVVLRNRVDAELPFAALLERVRETCLGAYEHQDVPFEQLVEEIQSERDTSRNPLFQAMLAWDRVPEPAQAGGLTFRSRPLHPATAKVDLTLYLLEEDTGLEAALEYSTALFDAPTVQRLGDHLLALLAGAAAEPERPLADLLLLLPAERAQLVREWNDTAVERPEEVCLHELIERQAERTPDAPAVVFEGGEGRSLTYRELMQRAGDLASYLAGLGVGPESVVAIRAERSLELMVGLLGILKSGAAYLPLDSEYPEERLSFMQEDAGATVLLTGERLAGEWQGVRATPRRARPENPAYVIYTSGSTGRPKGVVIPHRGICNRLLWMQETYGLTPADRVLQKTPIGFDVSVWELFWPLMTGACLVLARPGGHRDGSYLAQLIRDERITTLHFVPSMLAAFLAEDDLSGCGSLVRVICSGEALPAELVQRFFERLGAELHNLYGPTEASVDVTAWRCSPSAEARPVPIGRPIAGIRTHVLDGSLRLAPLGSAGELWLGGMGLARGYLGRPDLTADRFRPDPLSEIPGERLYRTGDLARHRPDGVIDYLGRADHQVKIRGFRIELGEIEAALTRHPWVHEAVALVREDTPGDRRLAAYLTGLTGAQIPLGELRAFLQERLPEPMIPADFVVLDELPLSVNGKVDRKALPAPERSRAASTQGFVAPRNPTEALLAEVWSEVLGIDPVGVHDSFFALGGDSIRSVRVRSLLQSRGLDVTLHQIFAHRTIADLAREVRGGEASVLHPLPRLSNRFPLSFAQERLWVMDRLLPGSPVYNVFHALRLFGPLDPHGLREAFSTVVRRHEVLRTAFPPVAGEPVQEILAERPPSWQVEDLTSLSAAEREAQVQEKAVAEARAPFDLAVDPLLRLRLLVLGPEEHVLLLTLHHIACDDWSVGVLVREVTEAYAAAVEGRVPLLPELPVQYADFSVWQREHLSGAVLEEKLAWWKEHLGSDPPVLTLPTDRPRPPVQAFHGGVRRLRMPAALAADLKTVAQAEGATLFMALLAGWATMLSRAAGQPEVVVGCASANRDLVETEGLIGFFVNILPLRLDLRGCADWRELLHRVRGAALGGYDHADLPFEKLVAAVQPRRDLSHAALRQVGFAFENQPSRALDLAGGVTSQPLDVDAGVARLDLTLFLWEDERGDLAGVCEYNTDLFDPATVDRFLERFETGLFALAGGVDRPLPELAVRTALPAVQIPESNLTSSQLMFWFAHSLNPDVQLYFDLATTTYEMEGAIDVAAFRQAFQHLVDHCDALRSTIQTQGGIPMRRVLDRLDAPVELVDLSGTADSTAAYQAWLAERCQVRLELSERLFDCALVRLSPDRHVWFWNVHHIIADAWSLARIAEVLSSYYALALQGRLDEAQPLPSYQLYVDYERELRGSRRWERAREHWERRLATPWSRNAFYRRDPNLRTTRAWRHTVDLGEAGSAAVQRLTAEEDIFSPAVVFATVLFALQYRLSGERVLRIGTPFANRSEDFSDVVGLQMNACPLQIEMGDGETFLGLARKIQQATLETAKWQFYPVRNPPDSPVYDVYYNYQNVAFRELCGLPVSFDLLNSGHTQDLLDLQVRDFRAQGIFHLDFDLNEAAFDAGQGARTVGHFLRLLEAFEADARRPLDAVEMLAPEERRQVVEEWNATAAVYPSGLLHEWIEAQVDRSPEAEAVAFEGARITYGELDRRANRLAWRLIELGVGPDVRVGVYAERSLEMVVGLLGILKAGGAYVPLDPGYPEERVGFMARDARMPVILTQSRLAAAVPAVGATVVCLDSPAGVHEHRPRVEMTDANLAYVIFTSGSTGRPKGAMLPHAGICNRLLWMQEAYGLTADDRVLQKTPFSFDVSVWEFFWPLLTGATLVMATPGGHQDPAYLAQVLEDERISTVHFVPSMLQAFLAWPEIGPCSRLRRVLLSGEALPDELRRRFYERLETVDLHNLYGPTEASVDVTSWACPPFNELGTVPIGRPIANTQIYLMDRASNPVPPGCAGELAIGGVSLARGYLERPDLTAERFVPDPFASAPGGRLYRTGDLARHLPGGEIEYLSRLDHQVKIRGFRIELGEIEASLARHPGVREAVVLAREDRPGDRRLVAYVVGDEAPDTAGLRDFLQGSLPEHMVPSAVVRLDALPLTPSGKVDRRALPAPDQGALAAGAFVAPETPLQALLANIWGEVLDLERVGIHDSFFDLGGNSLAATRAVTLVQEVLPVELKLRNVFQAPTVARIAAHLEESIRGLGSEEQQAVEEILAEFELLMAGEENVDEMMEVTSR